MKTILPVIAACGFAMPCFAEPLQLGTKLQYVNGYGVCLVETSLEYGLPVIRGYCNDDEPVVQDGDMIYY